MAFVVRRVTIGKAQELLNDLLTNMGNVRSYDDSVEYINDLELLAVLSNWVRTEETRDINETKMDGEEGRGF